MKIKKRSIQEVSREDCIGCGLCEAVCPFDAVSMHEDRIGFVPEIDEKKCTVCGLCYHVCPGINRLEYPGLLGQVQRMLIGYQMEPKMRHQASSGAVCRTLLKVMLEKKIVDRVIFTRATDDPYHPETIVTDSAEELTGERLNSIYSPTKPLSALKNLDRSLKHAFVGLPCHIAGLSKAKSLNKAVTVTIGLFCSHTPSFSFVDSLLADESSKKQVNGVRYRGEGWPGFSKILFADSEEKKIPFQEMWKTYNARKQFQQPRCASCSYYSAEFADISLGDPWALSEEDDQGTSLIFVRSQYGQEIIEAASEELELRDLPEQRKQDILQFHFDSAELKQKKAGIQKS